MDKSFRQQVTNAQQAKIFLIMPKFFGGILHWLAGLFQLTEEEQKDAGIYLDDQYPS
jgi:hypothetical protein